MAVDRELRRAAHLRERPLQRRFGVVCQLEVTHRTARRADEVMVVVVGERFGEFEPCVIVVGDDSGHCADLFENRKVAVHTRLRKTRVDTPTGMSTRATSSTKDNEHARHSRIGAIRPCRGDR